MLFKFLLLQGASRKRTTSFTKGGVLGAVIYPRTNSSYAAHPSARYLAASSRGFAAS